MTRRPARRLVAALLAVVAAGCGQDEPAAHAGGAGPRPSEPPASMARCAGCHARIVEQYLAHGMADSLGAASDPPRGALRDAATGVTFRFGADEGGPTLTATRPDGGVRTQRLVGRIGAGLMDISWVATEIDPLGRPTGRLAFAPVETVTGQGLALAPFERDVQPAGLDQPVTADCLGCHTTEDVEGAARAPDAGPRGAAFPENLLGADLFARIEPLGCEACHGAAQHHADLMEDLVPSAPDEIGIARLGELSAGAQRDVCARCHLDGDAHIALEGRPGYGPQARSILVTRPVLVPARADDDFRFVSQLERLQLSACARATPSMTCTTCHEPHVGTAAQGTADFDRRCLACHSAPDLTCSQPPSLTVRKVSGEPPRTADGCVDCHVRRSQPFDLPGLRSADHFGRRRIPLPDQPAMRHQADPDGPLAVFGDERTAEARRSPAGLHWADGLVALGLYKQGRLDRALQLLDQFPAPGSAGARTPTAPPDLAPLETSAAFHFVRGLALQDAGRDREARAAYGDALALDAHHPEARLDRAELALEAGEPSAALRDASLLLTMHPLAEQPWNLRARAALRAGDLPAAAAALAASTERWPADPAVWHQLGRLLLEGGKAELARVALAQAARLEPSRPGLADDTRRADQSGP